MRYQSITDPSGRLVAPSGSRDLLALSEDTAILLPKAERTAVERYVHAEDPGEYSGSVRGPNVGHVVEVGKERGSGSLRDLGEFHGSGFVFFVDHVERIH